MKIFSKPMGTTNIKIFRYDFNRNQNYEKKIQKLKKNYVNSCHRIDKSIS